MAIEKGLYQAPNGLDMDDTAEGAALEIDIVNPDMVTLDDGSMEVTIIPDADVSDTIPFDGNIADILEDSQLTALSGDLLSMVESDMDSRKEWADIFVKGLDVLGFKY